MLTGVTAFYNLLNVLTGRNNLRCCIRVHIHGKVCTFTAETRHYKHGHIRISLFICNHLVRVFIDSRFVNVKVVAGETDTGTLNKMVVIERNQFWIDRESSVSQALLQGNVIAAVTGTGTGAAIDSVTRAITKEIDFASGSERQSLVLIFQHDNTFAFDLLRHIRRSLTESSHLIRIRSLV